MTPLEPNRVRAERSAEALRSHLGLHEPYVDPVAAAESLGIVVRSSDDLGTSFSGCLMLAGRTFGILYSTSIDNEGYQRFTVSHELGHHELRDHHEVILANGRHLSASDFTSNQWYEIEADAFASNFLMPRMLFESSIGKFPQGKEAVKGLSRLFGTSLTSTAIRYAQLSADPVAVIVSSGQQVLYCFMSESLTRIRGAFIRKGAPVPSKTTTGRFNRDKHNVDFAREDEGTSYLSQWVENPVQDFELYEDLIGLGRYGKTLTILFAPAVPDLDQEGDIDDQFTPDGKRYKW